MDGLIAYALSKKYVDGKTSSIATGVSWKGTKENISSLPQSGNSVGDLWHVNEDGNEYAWDGSKWEALGGKEVLPTITSSDNGKFLRVANGAWAAQAWDVISEPGFEEQIQTAVNDWLDEHPPSGGGGLTDDVKQALLDCFENVAWINDDGQTYYDALYAALYPPVDVLSISAVFTQGEAVIYDTDDLYTLRQYLTVTATMTDNTTQTVTNYTLSGTLTEGTSTITVSYGGKTTTFNVTVTHDQGHSDMTGWTDGIAYTNLEIVENEYAQSFDGAILQYSGWNRTGYVPCHGASTLTVPPLPQTGSERATSNWFYDENHNRVSGGINGFVLNKTQPTTVTVPSGAYYFIISSNASALATCVNNGIVPNA